MVKYDLSHLTQDDTEMVCGPIQDTEALFLYSIIRGMGLRRILEIGGVDGYSATNFIKAFIKPEQSILYTIDIHPVPKVAPNHKVIVKDATHVTARDIDHTPLDMVFFECHVIDVQMTLYNNLKKMGMITDDTLIVLHDTNLHPKQYWSNHGYKTEEGWVHQGAEREMANIFVQEHGYHAFSLHTKMNVHDDAFPMRHGVTLLQKFRALK